MEIDIEDFGVLEDYLRSNRRIHPRDRVAFEKLPGEEFSTRSDIRSDARDVGTGTTRANASRPRRWRPNAARASSTDDGDAQAGDGGHEGRHGEDEVFTRADEG